MSAALALSLVLLAAVLASSVSRWSEVLVAVPAAALLTSVGVVSWADARAEVDRLLPVVAFLGTLLVLASVCVDEGLFQAFGAWMARSSPGQPRKLLRKVFALAAATTAVLSLDATVVLLTPVVLGAARTLRVKTRPHAYATVHLANTASLLLPVSNLTNLLAFSASGLSFTRFSMLMAGPWLAVVVVEYLLFRIAFRADLTDRDSGDRPAPGQPVPVFVLAVLALTLAGFAVTSLCGLSPAWAALAGAVVLGARSIAQRRSTVGGLARSANIPFLIFVLALGIVVKAVLGSGGDGFVRRLLPHGAGLLSLLAIAGIAALLANAVNNLPATLVLLAPLSASGPGPILAVLIGVNIGPNLTYVGSLANLLWRRVLHQRGEQTRVGEFTRLGLLTVPVCLLVGVVVLWALLRILE